MEDIFAEVANPPEKTLSDRKREVADYLVGATQNLGVELVRQLNSLFMATWAQQNHHGLTPTQVVSGLDTKAASLFRTHGGMVEGLPTICPFVTFRPYSPGIQTGPLEVLVPPSDWVITYETDDAGQLTGRVTLTEDDQ